MVLQVLSFSDMFGDTGLDVADRFYARFCPFQDHANVCIVSVNDNIPSEHSEKKTLVQHIRHFQLCLLSSTCELIQNSQTIV